MPRIPHNILNEGGTEVGMGVGWRGRIEREEDVGRKGRMGKISLCQIDIICLFCPLKVFKEWGEKEEIT